MGQAPLQPSGQQGFQDGSELVRLPFSQVIGSLRTVQIICPPGGGPGLGNSLLGQPGFFFLVHLVNRHKPLLPRSELGDREKSDGFLFHFLPGKSSGKAHSSGETRGVGINVSPTHLGSKGLDFTLLNLCIPGVRHAA